MKKSSSPGNRSARARKPAPRRRAAGADVTSRPGPASRAESTPPTTLAVLGLPAPAGVATRRRVRFGYFNPDAREVHVVGSFNAWDPQATALTRDALGDWSVELDLPRGEHRYRFFVDGDCRDDPAAAQTARNPFGGFDAIMVVV